MNVRVKVVDQAGLREWRTDPTAENLDVVAKRKVDATGETVFCWLDEPRRFSWVCPSCGRLIGGMLGDAPVSGWDEPRWVNSGTRECPTLTPSLGCPSWRRGECGGHYWLRDGVLVQA